MKIRKLAAGFAMVLCLAGSVTGCKSGESVGYEKTIDALCESKEKEDVKQFLSLFGGLESLMSSVVTEDVFAEVTDIYKDSCGDDFKITYEISKSEKMDKDALAEKNDTFSALGSSGSEKLTQGYELEIQETAKGSKGKLEKTMNLSVGEANGTWYIVNFDNTLLK